MHHGYLPHEFNSLGGAKVPPAWDPKWARTYPFKEWCNDVRLWLNCTDMDLHKIASAIVLRLGGEARAACQDISTEILQGGTVDDYTGAHTSGVRFVLNVLETRFGRLSEEHTLSIMTEMMTFKQHQGEDIDAVLSRFTSLVEKCVREANMNLGPRDFAFVLLNGLG